MKNKHIFNVTLIYLALFIGLFFALFPIAWTISTSFKTFKEYYTFPPVWIPHYPTLNNYKYILFTWTSGLKYLLNSTVIASLNTVLVLLISIPAAYGIARFRIGYENLSFWILSQRMLPPIAVVIPYFLLFKKLGLIDTYLSLIIVYLPFNIGFAVWLLIGFFEDFPRDVEEAAMIDGCSRLDAIVKVVIPIIAPGIVVCAIFCFIFCWNEFMFALILTRETAKTVTAQLAAFQSPTKIMWGEMSALVVFAIIPVFILALLVQRYLVRGLALGAVKG
ncbi:carbohydrate ABC transporter permease [Candidatus Aerophobetes bacterium]|uniref:Carbohydrate ABC transporter permease n=1 Tax=Aerophobetes bacterium TaxID=2030807 RepID=A0A662DDP9_UNCAE|nr:MAG: carbohydrate ABC transporter permease [Candidatus Aerophobetes bacterium]